MPKLRLIAACCLPLWLAACAITPPPSSVTADVPAQWQAPLPHNGTLAGLNHWWQSLGDPLLVQLIDAAEAVSPTVASARSRIEQSRATRTAAGAALLPTLDGSLSASRGVTQPGFPVATTGQAALQASWEIDLFGRNRAASSAAQARLEGTQALWHDARVSVAAEVANQYFSLRTCERQVVVAQGDAQSRAETSRLADLATRAGFQAPANAALARASAAESAGRLTQQRALCDIDVKALVALTALPEPELRQKLAGAAAVPAPPIEISALPAQTLAQRPDVFNAEREVAAASAEVGSTQAQRYPRLSLQGAVGVANFRTGGDNTKLDTWTIGPVALTLPIFDAGRRAANTDAARARYDNAVVAYRAVARQAVREVEQALVSLRSTAQRSDDAQVALDGNRYSFRATEDLYKNGLASLLQLEDARRTLLTAETSRVSLQQERMAAGVALYRAMGGGWTPALAPLQARATAGQASA
ncbi:MAG: efflux transporter outer membrane subunit, partial [Burkholderiaceae bacterium]|nr:efflux transporter outer membrane subunit [Burkholderiaceae bacterium]